MRFGSALAIALWAGTLAAEDFQLSARIPLGPDGDTFGGLSGIHMSPDSTQILVLSDRAQIFRIALSRNEGGRLNGSRIDARYSLDIGSHAGLLDSEGIALVDGDVFISFESPPRILRYQWPPMTPAHVDGVDQLAIHPGNRGIEALAYHPSVGLIAIPERRYDKTPGVPIFAFKAGGWSELARLPQDGLFNPVGADFSPDGTLYILERAFSLLGFRTRIRRMTANGFETVLQTELGEFDNLEGLALQVDETGQLRALLVSDNNFVGVLRQELVEFILR